MLARVKTRLDYQYVFGRLERERGAEPLCLQHHQGGGYRPDAFSGRGLRCRAFAAAICPGTVESPSLRLRIAEQAREQGRSRKRFIRRLSPASRLAASWHDRRDRPVGAVSGLGCQLLYHRHGADYRRRLEQLRNGPSGRCACHFELGGARTPHAYSVYATRLRYPHSNCLHSRRLLAHPSDIFLKRIT